MTDTSDLRLLRKAYAKDVEDWEILGVMADAYLDAGMQDESDCLRWMARECRRPYRNATRPGTWMWQDDYGHPSGLPTSMYKALSAWKHGSLAVRYATCDDALSTILAAWKVAPQK